MAENDPLDPVLHADLSADGGGFLTIDLIAQAALRNLQQAGLAACRGTRLEVPLSFTPVNLPREKLPCVVNWRSGRQSIPGTGELDVAAGKVLAVLDLLSPGATAAAIGAWLESPTAVSVEVTPDYPYTSGPAVAQLPAPPKLCATLSWPGEPGKALTQVGTSTAPLRIGDVVTVRLERSSWRCHVRLRIGYHVGNSKYEETFVDFGQSGTEGRWTVGFDAGVLEAPLPEGNADVLSFYLRLQVSEDGKSYTNLTPAARGYYYVVSVPQLALTSFSVTLSDSGMGGLWPGRVAMASGALSGYSARARPPFWVELWAYNTTPPLAVMHPIGEPPVQLPTLDEEGRFSMIVDWNSTDAEIDVTKGWTPFGILRAGPGGPLPPLPLPPGLRYGALRTFADEDFAVRNARGVCSDAVTKNLSVSREPALSSGISWEIQGTRLVFTVGVLGSRAYWGSARAAFEVSAAGVATPTRCAATYAPIEGSAKGKLTGGLGLDALGTLAGKVLTVRLTSGLSPAPAWLASAGPLSLSSTPSVASVRWKQEVDSRSKTRLRFVAETRFFPRAAGWLFDVSFRSRNPLVAAPWTEEKPALTWIGTAGQTGADGTLQFSIYDEATRGRVLSLLLMQSFAVRVARPAGKEQIYRNAGLTVAPWDGVPTPLP